nr:cysteine-rich secretory protein Mr30-1 [Conus marmoreus]
MLSTMQTVGAILMLSIVFAAGTKRHACDSKYSDVTPTHTMCLTDNANAVAVTLTQEVKVQIVRMHNVIRATVNDAANMMKMEWDDRLAAVAQKWAMQCILGHDGFANHAEPDLPGYVGQNVGWSNYHMTFPDVVDLWAAEIEDYEYGVWNDNTGHYIQQIYAEASRIGCGQSACGEDRYFVCNYYESTMGNTPYAQGSRCGQCPNSCWEELCDCTSGPDACCNGGSLNIDTCECQCPRLWSGADCQEKQCPDHDYEDMCDYPDVVNNPEYWCQFSNIRSDCPIRCGDCP